MTQRSFAFAGTPESFHYLVDVKVIRERRDDVLHEVRQRYATYWAELRVSWSIVAHDNQRGAFRKRRNKELKDG